MGKVGSLLPKQNDQVECTVCGDTFARKYTDSHFRKHKKKLPIHPQNIPKSQRVVTVKPKSNLTRLWSKSVLDEVSENMQKVQPTLGILALTLTQNRNTFLSESSTDIRNFSFNFDTESKHISLR
eukprot:792238_1